MDKAGTSGVIHRQLSTCQLRCLGDLQADRRPRGSCRGCPAPSPPSPHPGCAAAGSGCWPAHSSNPCALRSESVRQGFADRGRSCSALQNVCWSPGMKCSKQHRSVAQLSEDFTSLRWSQACTALPESAGRARTKWSGYLSLAGQAAGALGRPGQEQGTRIAHRCHPQIPPLQSPRLWLAGSWADV